MSTTDTRRYDAHLRTVCSVPWPHDGPCVPDVIRAPDRPTGPATRPKPTCGTEPPFDSEGCGHDHHGALVCGEIVDTAWSASGAEPVYCEHLDRRYAVWLEQQALAAPAADGLDVERLAKALQSMNQNGWPWDPTAKDYWTLYAAAIAAAYLDSGEADGRSNEQQMIDGDRRQWPSREPGEERQIANGSEIGLPPKYRREPGEEG